MWARIDVPDTDVTLLAGWAEPAAYADSNHTTEEIRRELLTHGIGGITERFSLDRPNNGSVAVQPGYVVAAAVYRNWNDDEADGQLIGDVALIFVDGWHSTVRQLITDAIACAL
jgi:hypothetical protein